MTTPTPTCRLLTLGCKVNQYETQYVKELLEVNGYTEANETTQADLCVVNTCTVTAEGDSKSRQLIRQLHRKNPQASIVVMGCYATRDPAKVGSLPGVSKVITDKSQLMDDLASYGVSLQPEGISRFDDHSRAFVKVQDGCLLNCSYCIIPTVRPTMRSRPADEIVEEVARLIESGFREVVLTGIHLGHYGIDLSKGKSKDQWTRLWHLLKQLNDLDGDFRIRLSSLEAAEARDDLILAMAELPRIVPHLHLCLQSGSDRILNEMKRRYTSRGFLERCQRIRQQLDRPAFSTDVIIGFPGETDADFEDTYRVVEEAGFMKVHIFPFSPREGTPAATMAKQISKSVMKERRLRLQELEATQAKAYLESLIGMNLDVLVETDVPEYPGTVRGTSCRYASVKFRGYFPALEGQRVPVKIVGVNENELLGEPIVENLQPSLNPGTLRDRDTARTSLPLL